MRGKDTTSLQIELEEGGILQVNVLAPHTFRIRMWEDERFAEAPLVRYGVVRGEFAERPNTDMADSKDLAVIHTTQAVLNVDKRNGKVLLEDPDRNVILKGATVPWSDRDQGFGSEFELTRDERLYGLGDVTRDRINKRGYRTMMWVRNVDAYVPIPYLMSTEGWALLVNTTWRHYFDIAESNRNRLSFWGNRGMLDYYLFVGRDLPTLLDRYTDVAGKPHVLPVWAYGLTFVCNQQADAREMLDDCLNFRREGIPCDVIGLEPGWMSENYDYSVEKDWHPERFHIPHWSDKGPHTFLAAADRLGFKLSLWLCCDYDVSFEEERRAGGDAGADEQAARGRSADDFEQDEHLAPQRLVMDTITRPDEPWFEHLKRFVDQGVSAFKMDGSKQVMEHPDRKWGNGMDDERMHNLYPTILNKQMHIGFSEHTGRRPMVYSSGGYTGIQRYSATWAGDTGGGPKPLVSMLNHGMSGHSNTSCDMDVFTPAGIHFGFLQPWSQLCSWAYWRHPWLLGEDLLPMFKHYARLRYRLLPYIYSMAHVAAETGMPIMRSMPLAFPDDEAGDELLSQYMLGDALLVGAFSDDIHLPEGEWIDYWTDKRLLGPEDVTYTPPAERGGALFVRSGGIIPTWPDMDYIGQTSLETIGIHIYPPTEGQSEDSFTLYEDDGETFAYREGQVARTTILLDAGPEHAKVTISPREGEYENMPRSRDYRVWVHREGQPRRPEINGEKLEAGRTDVWSYSADSQATILQVSEDEERQVPVVISLQW